MNQGKTALQFQQNAIDTLFDLWETTELD